MAVTREMETILKELGRLESRLEELEDQLDDVELDKFYAKHYGMDEDL